MISDTRRPIMAQNKRDSLSIYFDLENVSKTKNVNIQKIMQDVLLKYETQNENDEPVFVFKIACGNAESISKYREQLKSLNFEIKETPHLVNKKNRSDLIISLDAFEKLYLDRPSIDEYIFITNDSDFSVIMDILRRYGKRVILVTTKEDSNREIFNNCADKILIIEEYVDERTDEKEMGSKTENGNTTDVDNNEIAINNLMKVLKALDPDKEYLSAQIGDKFKNIDKSFDIGKTRFKKFSKLTDYFQTKGIIKIDPEKNKYDKIITILDLESRLV
jgi:uncharacterized LabA/DUF88 family protein